MMARAQEILGEVRSNGWELEESFLESLPSEELDFVEIECGGDRTLDLYVQRLRSSGLAGIGRVLDAGCGVGQWSRAFAETGSEVCGLDLNATRLRVARALCANIDTSRLNFEQGSFSNIPLNDCEFDLVFCYGSLMFSEYEASLSEFFRVLKPGGLLYVNASSWGWYVKRSLTAAGQRKGSLRMLLNSVTGSTRNLVLGRQRLTSAIRGAGFGDVRVGPEGSLSATSAELTVFQPFYPGTVWFMPGVIEAFGSKSPSAARR